MLTVQVILVNFHVFTDAEVLRREWKPQFMLVHPMGLDYAGHCFGADTKQYRGRTIAMDSLLAQYLPLWCSEGYSVLITADHGMNTDGQHGGVLPDVRETPLFCLGQGFIPGVYLEGLSQLAIAPLICHLLSLPLAPAMQPIEVPGYGSSQRLSLQKHDPEWAEIA